MEESMSVHILNIEPSHRYNSLLRKTFFNFLLIFFIFSCRKHGRKSWISKKNRTENACLLRLGIKNALFLLFNRYEMNLNHLCHHVHVYKYIS